MRYHILSIGVSNHQESFIPNLSFASKDASDFFNLFTLNVGEIGYKKLIIDSEATLSGIRTALGSELISEVRPDDAFLFFFSGHGTVADDVSNKSLAHFIVPFDLTNDITNSAISVSYLKEVFDKLPCKAKMIFVDSCFSGSINSKCYPNQNKKAFKDVKTIANTITGTGSLTFTASKEAEEALEDYEFKNGLFTHYLLDEFQKERTGDKFAIVDVFTPVAEQVTLRAKTNYHHSQTPTLNSMIQDNVYVPVFKKKVKITPRILEIPLYPELSSAAFPVPEIKIEDKDQEKILNETIEFVVQSRQAGREFIREIMYERFCIKMIQDLKKEWEKIFSENGGDINNVPLSVARFEAASFQVFVLGAVLVVFGSDKQIKIYAENIVELLQLTKNRAGLVALTAVPEIIVAEIIYIFSVICIASKNFNPLDILLKTKVDDLQDRNTAPQLLVWHYYIHYCDALGGSADKVCDHIREFLKSFSWLEEIAPRLDNNLDDFQIQANYLLVTLTNHYKRPFWPDFGRWYGARIMPFIRQIKYDDYVSKQIATMFGVKEVDLRKHLIEILNQDTRNNLGGGYFWHSIDGSDFLTEEELRKIDEERRKRQVSLNAGQ